MEEKTKRSRPVKITFFVNDDEEKKIRSKAKHSHSLSDYLRTIAIKGKIIKPVPSIDREALLELNRIGNNINQIARALNQAEMNIFNKNTRKQLQENIDNLKSILHEKVIVLDEKIHVK